MKYSIVSAIVLLAIRRIAGDVCQDLDNGVDKQYTIAEVNECYDCEWQKITEDTRQSLLPPAVYDNAPENSRLESTGTAWCGSYEGGDYLEVQFAKRKIGGLVIKGYEDGRWITSFEVSYDGDGTGDYTYMRGDGEDNVQFQGPNGWDSEVERRFPIPVVASAIRIHPITDLFGACLRVDVYACDKIAAPLDAPAALMDDWFSGTCTLNILEDCGDLKCPGHFKRDMFNCEICECDETSTALSSKLFESDIYMTPQTKTAVKATMGLTDPGVVFKGASSRVRKWLDYKSNGKILIPYSTGTGLSSRAPGAIQAGIAHLASKTCIQLVKRQSQPSYINFVGRGGCFSPVGKQGGANTVSIGPGCEYTGVVVHEILHSLGFWHEQSRPDRDSFIRIQTGNIRQGLAYNFQKRSSSEINSLGSPYDLNSLMHYGGNAFSKNGQPTITTINGGRVVGQRAGLSVEDIKQVNKMYGCDEIGTTTKPATAGPGTPPPGACLDEHRYCRFWADIGECKENPGYMEEKCKRSCDACDAQCDDVNNNCPNWKQYCTSAVYGKFMARDCKQTCGLC